MKKYMAMLGVLALLGLTQEVMAASSDALTVTITPISSYDVDIDTLNVVLSSANATADADWIVVLPATVTINSTINTELTLDATTQTSAGTNWVLGSSNAQDILQAWTIFTSTTVNTPRITGDFDNSFDRMLGGTQNVGDTQNFEDGSTNMDDLVSGAKRHMWIKVHTPLLTTDANVKTMKITLSAGAPD
jgi:hypothetical protein